MTRRHSAPRIVKFLGVNERQIRVIASDATPDRMGDVLEPRGVQLGNFKKNPIVLAQHDSSQPIAKCASIGVEGNAVVALIEFPPAGVSDRSDEYLRLMKSGIIQAVSVGFLPLEWEPIRGAGLRFTSWELLELSCVSVPANPSALVTERSVGSGNSRADHLERYRATKAGLEGVIDRSPAPLADDSYLAALAEARAAHEAIMKDRAARADAAMRALQW
jgi:HK97 family phage prohead protease